MAPVGPRKHDGTYGGMSRDQLKRLKELEAENTRLRRAVSDLTLDKMILTEASRGRHLKPFPPQAMHRPCAANPQRLSIVAPLVRAQWTTSAGFAAHWVSIARHSARSLMVDRTKPG